MRVCIHRGADQIGGSCVELEQDGIRLVLDLGLPLDGDGEDSALLPAFGGVLAAVVISHPHMDHYGLLRHLPCPVPVCMGAAARRIITAAAPFTGQALPCLEGPDLEHHRPIQIGPFTITPHLVDHSAFDAYALEVEAGGKRLFYSGDFRAHGRKSKLMDALVAHPPKDIEVLLMEGSSLSRLEEDQIFPTEAELEAAFVEQFQATSGLALVYASAQNIDRVVTLYRACKRADRTLIIDLYTAAILEATGSSKIPQSFWPHMALFVPQRQRVQILKNASFDLLKKHAQHRIYADGLRGMAHQAVLLFRPLHMRDLEASGVLEGATFAYSQWQGYLEESSSAYWQGWLRQHGIPTRYIHTSGHASPSDLRRFANALAPKRLVPIHSFAPEKYPRQFENVISFPDGEWWEV